MNLSYLPNIITVARVALVFPMVFALSHQKYEAAIVLAFVAGATDAIDGYLARRWGWTSRFGSLLDPIADKLLLLAGFAVLAVQDLVPHWLFWLVIARDMIIVMGALCYQQMIGPLHGKPSWLSKINTVLQILLVLVVLITQVQSPIIVPPSWVMALTYATAVTTFASGVHYVVAWSRIASEERRRTESHTKPK